MALNVHLDKVKNHKTHNTCRPYIWITKHFLVKYRFLRIDLNLNWDISVDSWSNFDCFLKYLSWPCWILVSIVVSIRFPAGQEHIFLLFPFSFSFIRRQCEVKQSFLRYVYDLFFSKRHQLICGMPRILFWLIQTGLFSLNKNSLFYLKLTTSRGVIQNMK